MRRHTVYVDKKKKREPDFDPYAPHIPYDGEYSAKVPARSRRWQLCLSIVFMLLCLGLVGGGFGGAVWFLERDAGKQETQVAYDLLQTAHIQTQIAPQNGSTINFDDLPTGSLTPSPTSLGLPTSIITATSTDLPTPIPFSGTLPSSTGPVRVPYLVWTGNHIGVASSIAARVYEANKLGADPRLFQASNADIFSVDISPDQTRLVMGGGDGVVSIWNMQSGALVKASTNHILPVWSVAFSPDGERVVSGGDDGLIYFIDLSGKGREGTISVGRGAVQTVTFSPDGQQIAAGSYDGKISLWDSQRYVLQKTLRGHAYYIWSVVYNPLGTVLASASDDGIIRLWDVQSGDEIATFSGHIGAVKSLDFNPSGSQLASGGDDGTVKIWDIASRREIISIEVGAAITSAVFSPDGQQVLSAGQDGSLYLLDLASSSIYQTLPGR